MLDNTRPPKVEPTTPETAAPVISQEPGPDWVPLRRALFLYGRAGYLRTAEEWEEELRAASLLKMQLTIRGRHEARLEEARQKMSLVIDAEHLHFYIEGKIHDSEYPIRYRWPDWPNDEFTPQVPREYIINASAPAPKNQHGVVDRLACEAGAIFDHFREQFLRCLKVGAARIMARKNTVLAPFECIGWDQWQYFTLEEQTPLDEQEMDGWSLPLPDFSHNSVGLLLSATATGPAGEKLYAIHIAPGVASVVESIEGRDAEKKCQQWVLGLMRQFPERPPKPLPELAKEACSKFPGLSERGFRRAFSITQAQTGNQSWSKAGRLPKSRQKSPHKK